MIGIFDSGAGGLSVLKELVRFLPSERYFYISDAAYCPYGKKKSSEILERSESIVKFFIEQNINLVVIACNTATAASVVSLRKKFPSITFVGMEPAVKPAAITTKSGVIGVLATQGTFSGDLYLHTSEVYAKDNDIEIVERVGDGLVEAVEMGELEGEKIEALVAKYVDPMIKKGVDTIVLGCTHYPFLSPIIEKVAGGRVNIINPAPAIARRVKSLLDERNKNIIGQYDRIVDGQEISKCEKNYLKEKKVECECEISVGACKRKNANNENVIATTGKSLSVLKMLTSKILEEVRSESVIDSNSPSLQEPIFKKITITNNSK